MKKHTKNSIVIIIACSVFISNSVYAWNDKVTHPALTTAAISQPQINVWFETFLQNTLGFKEHVQEELPYENKQMTILNILKEGSELEDKPLERSKNHFHSPIDNMGLSQGEVCWLPPIPLLPKDWRCLQLEGESALAWVRGTGEGCREAGTCAGNQHSWISARESYRDAFEALRHNDHATWESKMAETFRSLGQVMHLVQDMAVPAHTRNDSLVGHILAVPPGNNLEKFLVYKENRHLVATHGANGQIPNFNHLSPVNPETKLHYFWDTDEYQGNLSDSIDNGLAEYTSANFLSTGRMFVESAEFPHPSMEDTDADLIDWASPELGMDERGNLAASIYFRHNIEGHRLARAGILTRAYKVRMPAGSRYLQTTTHLDDECHRDYAERLIPKAVGYSAGVLNYFFRGELEISPPDGHIYALIDGADFPHQFTTIKAKVRNVSQYQGVPEAIGPGKIWAIAKYKVQETYDPYYRDTDPDIDYNPDSQFEYSVSEQLDITNEFSGPENPPVGFEFVFTKPIPVGISDLYLQVVFEGVIGAENAIAVGMKNLNEPTHLGFFNSTDYIFVCNNNSFQLDNCPGFKTAAELEDPACTFGPCESEICPAPCNCGDIVACNPDPLDGEVCPYPLNFEYSLSVYPKGLETVPDPVLFYDLPAGYHARVIMLTDNETKDLVVDGTMVIEEKSGILPGRCPFFNNQTIEIFSELPTNRCECIEEHIEDGSQVCSRWACGGCECGLDEAGLVVCGDGGETHLLEHRGVKTHRFLLEPPSVYGQHSYLLKLQNQYGLPTSLGQVFLMHDWPQLVSDDPWPADLINY